MINETSIKVPKKYHDKLEIVYKDVDGYWAETKPGFYFDDMTSHTAHEDTQKALLSVITSVKPCNCYNCQRFVK